MKFTATWASCILSNVSFQWKRKAECCFGQRKMGEEDLWKVNSNCSAVSFPVTEVFLKEVYLCQVKHRLFQSCSKTGEAPWEQHLPSAPIAFGTGRFLSHPEKAEKAQTGFFFVHTESKKASSSSECVSRSLLLHHLFLLQKPRSGVVCSMEFSLPHLPAIVLGFFIVCLSVLYASFCGFDSDINVYRLLDFFLL